MNTHISNMTGREAYKSTDLFFVADTLRLYRS